MDGARDRKGGDVSIVRIAGVGAIALPLAIARPQWTASPLDAYTGHGGLVTASQQDR